MLTPEYLASFSSGYLGMVDNLNEQIVRDIARRMIKTGKVNANWNGSLGATGTILKKSI